MKTQKKSEKIDRGTQFCIDVLGGGLKLAGPFVRGSCQRHLSDREREKRDPNYPFHFNEHEAAEAMAFFEEILKLAGGQWEGRPFLLLPWQAFIISSLFGWKRKSDGMRRFRVAYIETPKGSGKSPLAAGIGLKGLCADKEERAFVFAAATKRDQAMILFRDAVACVEQSPLLRKRLVMSGLGEKCWNLSHLESGSFFRVVSAEKKGLSGERPHVVLLDEVHEHADGTVIEQLRAGFKTRTQPLMFLITNSGFDRSTVCWEYHDMGAKIACSQIENDEFFSFICALDNEDLEGDKYLDDESLWEKVNPSLKHGLPGYDYIRGQVREARGMPSKMATVKRLCFCVWTESENPAISREAWIACEDKEFPYEKLAGRRAWGGLDLSAVNDLTSFGLMFAPEVPPKITVQDNGKSKVEPFTEEEISGFLEDGKDPFWRLKVWFWVPGKNLHRKQEADHVPYLAWRDSGLIFTSPGEAISKTQIVRFIYEETAKYDLVGIAYDRNRMKDLIEFAAKEGIDLNIGEWDKKLRRWNFKGAGIPMMPFGQEARSMTPAIDKFEFYLLERLMRHDGNPCLTWCASNAVIESDGDYKRYSKKRATGRIDGIQVTAMACGILEDIPQKQEYQMLFV